METLLTILPLEVSRGSKKIWLGESRAGKTFHAKKIPNVRNCGAISPDGEGGQKVLNWGVASGRGLPREKNSPIKFSKLDESIKKIRSK